MTDYTPLFFISIMLMLMGIFMAVLKPKKKSDDD